MADLSDPLGALDTDLSSDCLLQGAKELPFYHISDEHRSVPKPEVKFKV